MRAQSTSTLPEWTRRYDDILAPELRGDLAIWRAATGVKPDERSLAGPMPDDEREAAYHRHLVRTINARYGDALRVWETKIIDYTGKRDDHTATLAKQLDDLARRGHDADRLLDLAAARKPLPVDHPDVGPRLPGRGAGHPEEAQAPDHRPVPQVTPARQRPGPRVVALNRPYLLGTYRSERYYPSMRSTEALRILTDVTAYQWGMVTSVQASMHGITRLDLSRLAEAGHLERLAHGVYKDAGAPASRFDDLHAAWLSTDPKTMGEVRIKDNGVVVAGETAADLHGIGDFRALRHDFVSPTRRQSQRREIRYRQRALEPRDVMLVEGLPVMTMERTIADLVDDNKDLSLVGDALRDGSGKRTLDLQRLRELLAPFATRDGFKKGEGDALLQRLMEIAGIDPDALAGRVAQDETLGSLVAAKYVGGLSKTDLNRIIMTPEMEKTLRAINESLAAALQRALAPQLAEINASSQALVANLVKNSGIEEVLRKFSTQVVSPELVKALSQGFGAANATSSIGPQTLAIARATQNATGHA